MLRCSIERLGLTSGLNAPGRPRDPCAQPSHAWAGVYGSNHRGAQSVPRDGKVSMLFDLLGQEPWNGRKPKSRAAAGPSIPPGDCNGDARGEGDERRWVVATPRSPRKNG